MGSDETERIRVGRGRGFAYAVAALGRILAVVLVVALLVAPIALIVTSTDRQVESAGAFVATGLALLGAGLPLIAVILARVDWARAATLFGYASTGRPEVRFREPGTLVRPLAYTVVMLTLGGAAAVLALLIVIGSVVALASPLLTATGDLAVIGPFTVSTMPQSIIAALVAAALLTGLVLVAPLFARAHARVALLILTRPEQRLERALTSTAMSRARLVRAFDVERRRIERDLHDGVQPQLMAVSMTLGLALAEMPGDAPGRDDVLRAQQQAQDTIDALRRFVRNIHPQVLVDHGLGAAVGELADSLTLPITVTDDLPERCSTALESTLFFCIAELLTNTVKHSVATRAEVTLTRDESTVRVTVFDDGTGGARTNPDDPGGLDGITDRLAAFDGALTLDSPVGGPTVATITVQDPQETHAHD